MTEPDKNLSVNISSPDNTLGSGMIKPPSEKSDGVALLPADGVELTSKQCKELGLSKGTFNRVNKFRHWLAERFNVDVSDIVLLYEKGVVSYQGGQKIKRDSLHVGFGEVVRNEEGHVIEPHRLQFLSADGIAKVFGFWGRGSVPTVSTREPAYDHRETERYADHVEWMQNAIESRKRREALRGNSSKQVEDHSTGAPGVDR